MLQGIAGRINNFGRIVEVLEWSKEPLVQDRKKIAAYNAIFHEYWNIGDGQLYAVLERMGGELVTVDITNIRFVVPTEQ